MSLKSIVKPFVPDALRSRHKVSALEREYAVTYLAAKGWQKSALTGQATNNDGPVPWYTYPAIEMLKRVVRPHYRVFEFGSGNSSLWWAAHAAEVVSVEDNEDWAKAVSARAPSNLNVLARPRGMKASSEEERQLEPFHALGLKQPELASLDTNRVWQPRDFSAYALALAKYPRGHFDIIVIDGVARVLTTWLAAQCIKPGGFLLFDNSDRDGYGEGYAILADAGFKRIDFFGTGPVNCYEWCTSIFAKDFDWLSVNR